MQAIGAYLRGESAQEFMQNLAKTNPQLQELDLTGDLNKTAEQLYQSKGEDIGAAKASIKERLSQFIANK